MYYIGGFPCSGKSTVAEIIAKKYGFYYFKVDDYLEDYIKKGAASRFPVCTKIASMSPEETWMREPKEQNEEELAYYQEVFQFVREDIQKHQEEHFIITEGAAFLPDLMKQYGVDANHYMTITPTPEFQISHYRERPWVPYVLSECSNKETAFMNWMNRDILFAKEVNQ